jgi:hypothetical protein
MFVRKTVLLVLFAYGASAQTFNFGVLGGVRTAGSFTGNLTDESKRYVFGPAAELQLPHHFSFEVDGLYRRFGYSDTFVVPIVPGSLTVTRERDNSWEFPVLAKYHVPIRRLHPFAGAGVAPRTISGHAGQSGYTTDFITGLPSQPFSRSYKTSYDPTVGMVIAGGVEIGAGRIRFTPQVRYTWWNARFLDETVRNYGFLGLEFYQATQNQLDVMIGINWRTR